MKIVSIALDILQGEEYMYMGMYAPTIFVLLEKLHALTNLKYCTPVQQCLINGINKR